MGTTELIAMIREGVRGADPGDTMMFPETEEVICVAELLEVADRMESLERALRVAKTQVHHERVMRERAERLLPGGDYMITEAGGPDEVMWICAVGDTPVGIVKHYDEIEKRWKFYIGTGKGEDLDEDVQRILAMGQKFYSLDFIQSFAEVQEDEG